MPTKTKTSPSGLTPDEQKEFERRGFLVKNTFSILNIIAKIIFSYVFTIFAGGASVLFFALLKDSISYGGRFIIIGYLSIFLCIVGFLFSISSFVAFIWKLGLGRRIYFLKNIIIQPGKEYRGSRYDKIFFIGKSLRKFNDFIYRETNYFDTQDKGVYNSGNTKIVAFIIILVTSLLSLAYLPAFFYISLISICGIYGFMYLIIPILSWLHRFGILASKIQSLTPRITEESEKIEKEFSTDMNFRTLSDSFDTLSKDFSKISSYVIKLETIEQKANKGNLFDSEKYIGSLREDIVKPLTALRSFLEKKKTELQSSEQEVKKVRLRVGGVGNGGAENLELQSKRSEPLISELTENIEKLDMMIEKFGKI